MRDVRWYLQEGDEAAQTLTQYARRIREEQERRQQDRLFYAALYGWREAVLGYTSTGAGMLLSSTESNRLSLNIVRTMVDAATARIAAAATPKATFATNGGDFERRTRARQMDQGIQGVFYSEKHREKALMAFRAALVFGESWLWHEADHVWGKPRIVRTLPGEVFVDETECLTGEPRRLYRERFYDRRVLAEMFPASRADIMAAKAPSADSTIRWGYDPNVDQLLVTEGWSLPSGPDAKDGRYLATCAGIHLEGGEYTRDRFPGARYTWDRPEVGFYGQGLAEELAGIQIEINDLLDQINDAHQSVAGKWLIEQTSRVNPNSLTDERDGVIVYLGTAPAYITPNAVPPQMYEYLWQLVSRAYEITGISQLAATSQKPAGLNSGAAIRAYTDNQSTRFKHKIQGFEEFHCESARLTVDSIQDLALEGDVRIRVITDGELQEVDWKKVALDSETYELQVEATSELPSTVAGRLALVQDLSAVPGLVKPEDLLELMSDIPDVQAFVRRRSATRRLTQQMLSNIAEGKGFEPPEPEMDLATALGIASESYLDYRASGVPGERLDEIQRWMQLARQLQQAAAPPPAPAPPPMPQGAPPV